MFRFIREKLQLGRLLYRNHQAQTAPAGQPPPSALSADLQTNLQALRTIFRSSSDVVFREFRFGVRRKIDAALVYVDGMVNAEVINENILRPLMFDTHYLGPQDADAGRNIDLLEETMLSVGDTKKVSSRDAVVDGCLTGKTALLLDGAPAALMVSARGWESRGIEEPKTEIVVRGPREGFTETLRSNTTLLRRKIHNPDLRMETMTLGQRTKTEVCIAYLQEVASPQLVEEVKRRLQDIKIDAVLESGYLEGFIEDAPFSPFSTVGNSEKPDVVAAKLLEGRVAVLVDGTPFVLTVPLLFVESFQVAEDYYSRPYFTSLVRMLRFTSFFLTVSAPPLYVALTTFHQEMIPTALLTTLAAAKEGTPFPAVVEVLIMGALFEILREAGVRLPRPVGSAISIVGALVIGQAAVEAGLIGAPVVILVAMTAISSFVVPSQADVAVIARLSLTVVAGILGAYGVLLALLAGLFHLASLRSFGVPYLSPLAPTELGELKDVFVRLPIWALLSRPSSVGTPDPRRQGFPSKPGPPPDDAEV